MDKLDMILEKLDGMDGEIKGLRTDMDEVKGEITGMKGEITGMKGEITGMKGEITGMKGEIIGLKDKVGNIEFVLENEIRTNIARIAEGHLDLSRNLHEAIKTNNEFEMLAVRVNVLESDVRILKQKIS